MTRVSIMKYVFLGFGVLSVAGALVSVTNTRAFVAQAVSAHGTVIDLVRRQSSDSDTYAPVVRFVTQSGEQIEFTSRSSSNPPSYTTGERVEVLYRPPAPRDARINAFESLWMAPVIFGALGSIFLAIGGVLIVAALLQARKAADLVRNGKRIVTTVQRVELNENVQVNGRNPYRVFTQWKNPATGATRVFQSSYVWFDPSSYLNGRDVAVFVGRNDPKRYYVDLSFLPESAT